MGKEAGLMRCSGRIPGSGRAGLRPSPCLGAAHRRIFPRLPCGVHTRSRLPGRTALVSLFGRPPPEWMLSLPSCSSCHVRSSFHPRARLPTAFHSILQEQLSQGTQSELLKIERELLKSEIFIYEDRQTKKNRWTFEGSLWPKNGPR